MIRDTDSGDIDIVFVKSSQEMSTIHGKQHPSAADEELFLKQ